MAEPLLPHPFPGSGDTGESGDTVAAEPGLGAEPQSPEEPDVLDGRQDPGEPLATDALPETPFRTPTPGAALSPDELAAES